MIPEDVLERGLGTAADAYDVPADGVERLRELLAPRADAAGPAAGSGGRGSRRWPVHRPGPRGWLGLAAAAVVVLVAVPIAVGGGGPSSGGALVASSPAPAKGAVAAPGRTNGVANGGVAAGGSSGFSKSQVERAPLTQPAQPPAAAAPDAVAAPEPQSFDSARVGAGATTGGASAAGAPSTVVPNPAAVPERIVKTGELDLEVRKGEVSRVLTRLTALAALERGYVADSHTIEGGGVPSGVVALRVPVGSFDDTVNRARGYGSKVLSLETSAQDVTSRYVDLGARISALQKTRATFLTLLGKATTIGETLAVQQRVSDVQTQIERLQGERKVLANRSALSTLTVTVNQRVVVAAAPHQRSGFVRAVDRSVSRFVRGVEAIVGVIGPILLALILIALAWLGGRAGYRLLRRRLV